MTLEIQKPSNQSSLVDFLTKDPVEVQKPEPTGISFDGSQDDLIFALRDLVSFVEEKYTRSKDARQVTEKIWMDAWRAFRGEYSPEELAAISEAQKRNPYASKMFVKITKTKTNAALGQLLEVLESDQRFPVTVEETPVPEGVPEHVYLEDPQLAGPTDVYGYEGDGREIEPGATHHSLLKGAAEKLKNLLGNKVVKEGPSPDKTKVLQVDPAKESAMAMDKLIQDQLVETQARHALRKAALEQVIYGTGIIKGPFTEEKIIHDWIKGPDGKLEYSPRYKLVPRIDQVSVWNIFPDPEASETQDAEYTIERRLMSRSQLRSLRNQPTFDKKAIDRVLENTPTHQKEDWENHLKDNSLPLSSDRYRVLEYWGYLDKQLADRIGLKVTENLLDQVQVNIWVAGGEVIRVVLNPFIPARIPYFMIPYEESPNQVWGTGVPENMKDSQGLMNGHYRMMTDNLRLAGNAIFMVDNDVAVPGQNFDMYAGKIVYAQNSAGKPPIQTLTFNSTANEHLQAFDKARQLADEVTGIPSYSHGQTGISGTTRTASGMSMLMGASALNIKTVIKNWDHHLLRPLGEALFAWNMQFNEDLPEIRGDLMVKASGTQALMQREVLTQRILSLTQVAANPLFAPYFNVENAFKEFARALDLDPDTFVNDGVRAALYAEQIMSKMNGGLQGNPSQAVPVAGSQGGGSPANPDPGANPQDTTGAGGGNIGVGSAPLPGEAGFAG